MGKPEDNNEKGSQEIDQMEVAEPDEGSKGCDLAQKGYPKHVFFILGMEFCERFCYYGMKAVLQSYLMFKLATGPDTAASLYHAFAIVTYFTPLPGAILADSFIGRYKTIFSLSIVYVIGNIIMATTAIGPGYLEGALVGMFTIAIGTGGIKPCVSAFGADQFKAGQERMQKSFFSMFYITVNAGALMSQFITPLVKSTPCFGETECWVLAFGLPAALMVIALIMFLIGSPFYTKAPVVENVPFLAAKAFCIAVGRSCGKHRKKVDHWMDRAVPDYPQEFVDEIKAVLRVLLLFIPLPFFWALFEQQGSRWTYQAQKMNTYIDFLDVHLEAEQIHIFNGLFVVTCVPIFDLVVYPLFAKCNLLIRPLQRMVAGCMLAATAFLVIGFIQLSVQGGNDVLDVHDASTYRTRAFNINPDCSFDLYINTTNVTHMNPYDQFPLEKGIIRDGEQIHFRNIMCKNGRTCPNSQTTIAEINPIEPLSTVFFDGECSATFFNGNGSYPRTTQGDVLEFLYQVSVATYTPLSSSRIKYLVVVKSSEDNEFEVGKAFFFPGPVPNVATQIMYSMGRTPSYNYKLKIVFADNSTETVGNFHLMQGGAYTIYLTETDEKYVVQVLTDKKPNAMSAYWQIIPIFIITWGEILFSITGLSFAFSQSPVSMKSILTASWLLTNSFGNIIDLIIIEIRIPDKAVEFFLFSGMMYVVTVIFGIMTYFYKYVEERKIERPLTTANVTSIPAPPSMPYLAAPPGYSDVPTKMVTAYPEYAAASSSSVYGNAGDEKVEEENHAF